MNGEIIIFTFLDYGLEAFHSIKDKVSNQTVNYHLGKQYVSSIKMSFREILLCIYMCI